MPDDSKTEIRLAVAADAAAVVEEDRLTGDEEFDWRRHLLERGHPRAEILGRGMEGVIYALGAGQIAKIWFTRPESDLKPLVAFYQELRDASLPFATPEIHEMWTVNGRAVTIERELTGIPLRSALDAGLIDVDAAQDCALAVLEPLASSTAGSAAQALPVFNEAAPLWHSDSLTWGDTLAGLLQRRLDLYADQLRPVVTDFDAKVAGMVDLLGTLPPYPRSVVHGDLCTPNILIDTAGRVTSVLDWGFLSTLGDPALDASIFAGIFDMYGPQARERDDDLTGKICARFGYSRELLLFYRAFYALAASNVYDPAGRDGHFAWCVAALNRQDVSDVLLG